MPKKKSKLKPSPKSRVSTKVVKKTLSRKTPVPKSSIATRREVTYEMVAKRAYEIFAGGTGGDETHNWLRAERELRTGL